MKQISLGICIIKIVEFKLPIYYVTTGQSVPDDIDSFTSEEIVDKVLGVD